MSIEKQVSARGTRPGQGLIAGVFAAVFFMGTPDGCFTLARMHKNARQTEGRHTQEHPGDEEDQNESEDHGESYHGGQKIFQDRTRVKRRHFS